MRQARSIVAALLFSENLPFYPFLPRLSLSLSLSSFLAPVACFAGKTRATLSPPLLLLRFKAACLLCSLFLALSPALFSLTVSCCCGHTHAAELRSWQTASESVRTIFGPQVPISRSPPLCPALSLSLTHSLCPSCRHYSCFSSPAELS